MSEERSAESDADTIAFVAQEVLEEHMNLGTSGRYLCLDCGMPLLKETP